MHRRSIVRMALKSYRRVDAGVTISASDHFSVQTKKTMKPLRYSSLSLVLAAISLATAGSVAADDLVRDSRRALQQLMAQNPAAVRCKSKALAVLVFPDVVKAGFIFGAQGGQGILFLNGRPSGRYRTVAASYGLQAGVQKYGYALFLMNQNAVNWVNNTRGWSIGTGPSVVVVDKGMARSFTTDTLHSGIYAFTFDQQGLMAGLGLQGSKIMRID